MAGLYFHIPFCRRRCSYCDFYFVTGSRQADAFVKAMNLEIRMVPTEFRRESVQTVYFGGGTPSRLSPGQLELIVNTMTSAFSVADGAEWTIEVNPDDCSAQYLSALQQIGFNRLSIGIQSLKEADLEFMHRAHTTDQARETIELARSAGFDQFSVDLIFGLPDQTIGDWTDGIRFAADQKAPHISTYGLTVEPKTLLYKWIQTGTARPLDTDLMAEMYLETMAELESAGYHHYEISSFALPGSESRHNRAYWDHTNYLGFGPSAHSFWIEDQPRRWSNVRNLRRYLAWSRNPEEAGSIVDYTETLDVGSFATEYVMLALRTSSGIQRKVLANKYGFRFSESGEATVAQLADEELLTDDGSQITLTRSGKLLADAVAVGLCTDDMIQPSDVDESDDDPGGL